VSTVVATPDAPQCGDRKICKLFVFSACCIWSLSWCRSSRSSSSPTNLRTFLLSQLKCTHLVPAKVPLPEEVIFNQKQDAVEKRRAARKAQHKKHHIAKRDRNDNHNKRWKAGELGVSSDEDPSPEPSWSGDVASAAVDWSNMSGSSSSSPPRGTEVSSSRQPQAARRDKNVGSSLRQAARPAREDQRTVRPRVVPSGTGASEMQRSAPCQADPTRQSEEHPSFTRQLYDGPDRPDSDSLQRRRSRRRSSDSVSTLSAPPAAEPSAAPRRLQSLLIQGGGAPDVHVSLVAGGGHDLTLAVAEAGESALEQEGKRVAAVEAAVRSGAAPELAGSKRAAPEQGTVGRPVKKARVRSKM
jgi:hypothetical protein